MTRSIRFGKAASQMAALAALLLMPAAGRAQTRGAELTSQKKPDFPEALATGLQQGNVLLIGRIDKTGKLQDLRAVSSTLPEFIAPALVAAKAWTFKPAMRDGKPVDIAANIAVRFRLQSNVRGQIARPILGDLSVLPANDSGKASAPEGFPIQRGGNPRLRVEAELDISPDAKAREVDTIAEAVSPKGRRVKIFQGAVKVKPGQQETKFAFDAPVGKDWEDGVWKLQFTANGADAGSGQFWLAGDPAHYDFVTALKNLK
ncbi:MAG TPA: energy transducer TonB [Thermoanaerobaculia bacterium]